jgi:hypothetical protein
MSMKDMCRQQEIMIAQVTKSCLHHWMRRYLRPTLEQGTHDKTLRRSPMRKSSPPLAVCEWQQTD